jgi:hypothetical protein
MGTNKAAGTPNPSAVNQGEIKWVASWIDFADTVGLQGTNNYTSEQSNNTAWNKGKRYCMPDWRLIYPISTANDWIKGPSNVLSMNTDFVINCQIADNSSTVDRKVNGTYLSGTNLPYIQRFSLNSMYASGYTAQIVNSQTIVSSAPQYASIPLFQLVVMSEAPGNGVYLIRPDQARVQNNYRWFGMMQEISYMIGRWYILMGYGTGNPEPNINRIMKYTAHLETEITFEQ